MKISYPNICQFPDDHRRAGIRVYVLLLLVYLCRMAFHIDSPQLWAEDGTVFFMQARQFGGMSIIIPYAGYFHLMPRLVAWSCGHLFSLEFIPTAYFWCANAIAIVTAAYWLNMRPLPYSIRLVMAFSLFVFPTEGEAFGTITNLHWLLASVFFLLLIARRFICWKRAVPAILAVVLVGFSSPVICIFAPLFCWRAITLGKESRQEKAIAFSSLMAFVVQVCAILMSSEQDSGGVDVPMTFIRYIQLIVQVPVGLFLGRKLPLILAERWYLRLLGGVFFGAALGGVACAFWKSSAALKRFSIGMFTLGLLPLLKTLYRFINRLAHFSPFESDRYFVIPYSLWFGITVLLLTQDFHEKWVRLYSRFALAIILIGSLATFFVPMRLNSKWNSCVKKYREQGRAAIQIAPGGDIWTITLDRNCSSDDNLQLGKDPDS